MSEIIVLTHKAPVKIVGMALGGILVLALIARGQVAQDKHQLMMRECSRQKGVTSRTSREQYIQYGQKESRRSKINILLLEMMQ